MLGELLQTLEADGMERLRWRVCREFGVLPGGRDKRLTDRELIWCGLNMILDRRNAAGRAGEIPVNPAFDPNKFERMACRDEGS